MSLNGLSFTRDDFLLEPGMTLLLAIPIEDSRDEIRLPGKVVWVKVGDDRQVQVDVAFE
ncbi:MAG: PilZ domain-containing protein, partial [Candidatus Sericytochromatia bacterium]|nr:PilZ domain-containing protein [Candidatus Tanganyikabacteria bacterium]